MTHVDADDLALIALGEREAAPMERAHLSGCAECAEDLLALQHTVDVGRAAPVMLLLTPDPAAWERIHFELGLSDEVTAVPDLTDFASVSPGTVSPSPVSPPTVRPAVVAESGSVPAPVVTISRFRRLWIPLAAAAVVGLVAGYAASSWFPGSGDEPSVLARADLDPLPGWNGTGQASVETTAAGHRDVLITLASGDVVSPDAPLREVWLLSSDATRLVSLGFLSGARGRFAIPAEIDLAQYPLVDVSAEPNDGNPAHSADSVVRGELRSS